MILNLFYRLYARINWLFYRVYAFKNNLWRFLFPEITHQRFFWDRTEQLTDMTISVVPEYTIHVEQWSRPDGDTRRYVTYSMNPIRFYETDPFLPVKTPWLWIGDPKDDSVDITSDMRYYLVAGNLILPELVQRVTGIEEPHYMDPRSLAVLKFPEEGIVLEHDPI